MITSRLDWEGWCLATGFLSTIGIVLLMGYDGSTGSHNSFLFVPSAEVLHGRKT